MNQWNVTKRLAFAFSLGILSLALFSVQALAQQGPSKLNISGGLYNPNGTPVTNSSVNFRLEVWDKNATCVLYSEVHLGQNLSSSKGGFALEIGSGTSITNNIDAGSPTALSSKVFENPGVVAPFAGCAGGVTLASGDNRSIRVFYDLGSGYTAMTPDVPIASSAYAMVADTLQGKRPADFVQIRDDVSTDLNQTNVETIFSAVNFAKLVQILSGNFGNTTLTNVGTPSAGTDGVNKNYADANVGGKIADVSSVGPASGNGQTLIWDQAQNRWVTGTPVGLDATKLPLAGGTMTGAINMGGQNLTATGNITMSPVMTLNLGTFTNAQEATLVAGLGVADKGKFWYNTDSNVTKAWNGTLAVTQAYLSATSKLDATWIPDTAVAPGGSFGSATQVPVFTVGGDGRITAVTNTTISGVAPAGSAGGDLTGTYPNPTIANNAVTTVKVNNDAITSAKINSTGIAVNRILMTDATTGATVGYKSCALGESLRWTATGWDCTTVANLLGTSGVTAATYGTATQVAQVQVDAQGRVTSAANVNIDFPVVSVAGKTGAVTLNTADISGLGTAAVKNFGTAAGNLVELDGTGKIPASLLPTTSGDIQDVVAGGGLLGGGSSGAVTLSVDTGITTGKIVQMAASDKLPAVDGSNLTQINAVKLQSRDVAATAPTSGQYLVWNAAASAWEPQTLPAGNIGDITSVSASTGLLGGSASGDATLAVDVGVTTGKIVQMAASDKLPAVDGSDLTQINAVRLQTRSVSSTAPTANQILKWNGALAQWEPSSDVDTGITQLTGDVTAGPGSGSVTATIPNDRITAAKINSTGIAVNRLLITDASTGANVTYATCALNEILKWTATGWTCATDAGGSGFVTNIETGNGLLGGPITTTGTLSVDTGVTTGKIIQVAASNKLPVIDGSNLTFVNAVKLQTRDVAATAPTAGQYLVWNAGTSAWEPQTLPAGNVGDMTSVTASTGLLGGAASGDATLSVDVGVTTGKIVQMAASDKLPAVDGSDLTQINAVRLQTRAVSATAPTAAQVLSWNAGSSAWEPRTDGGGSVTSVVSGTGLVAGNITAAGTLNVDVGVTTGKIIQVAASDKLPVIDGSNLTFVNAVKLQTRDVASTAPTAAQVLGWNAGSSTWEPQTLPAGNSGDITSVNAGTGLLGGSASGDATLAIDVGTTTGQIVQMAASNKLPAVDGSNLVGITASQVSGAFANGGNAFGAAATLGTNDNFAMNFEANGATAMTILPSGYVGIGTASPTGPFHVVGGTAAAGPGATITIAGQNAGPGINNGGNIDILAGTRTGTANDGVITLKGSRVVVARESNPVNLDLVQMYSIDSGDNIGNLSFQGRVTGSAASGARIRATTTETWVDGSAYGTKMSFETTPNTTATPVERLVIDQNGNVGIGTTSPQSMLHVNGIVRATDICDENGANCKDISGGWGGGGDIDGVYTSTGLTGGFASGSGTLAVDVGTTTGQIVQMAASNKLPAVDGSNLVGITASQVSGAFANGGNAFGAAAILGTNDNFALNFEANGATAMTVLPGGNVGVGTVSPSYLLDVNGIARVTTLYAGAGTSANPGITFSGDPDTGFHNSANGVLDFTTNGINAGSINSSRLLLHRGIESIQSGGGNLLSGNVTTPTAAGDILGSLSFGTSSTTLGARVRSFAEEAWTGSARGSSVAFYTTPIGSTTLTEVMRLQPSGFIGIGTASPQSLLHVNGVVRATDICDENGANCKDISGGWGGGGDIDGVYTSTGLAGGFASGSGTLAVDVGTTTGKIVQVAASNKLPAMDGSNLTSINAVQIQTRNIASTAPTAAQVLGWNAGNSTWEPQTVSIAGSGGFINGGNSFGAAATLGTNDNFAMNFEANGATALTILPSGNVGIGTTNPSYLFQVNSSGNSAYARINHNSSTDGVGWHFGHASGGTYGFVGIQGTANAAPYNTHDQMLVLSSNTDRIALGSGTTERMRIEGANVGIGTTAPTRSLHISGASAGFKLEKTVNDTSSVQLSLHRHRNGSSVGNGNPLGRIEFNNDDSSSIERSSASITSFVDGTPGVNDVPGNLVFSTTNDGSPNDTEKMRITNAGNVGIGTTNPQSLLHVNGIVRATDICDENGANCKDISGGWGGGGDIDGVYTSTGLTGGFASGSGTLAVDVGTTTGQIVQVAASNKLPALDGSNLTAINAVQLQTRNIASTAPTASQVLGWNAGTSAWEPQTVSIAGSGGFINGGNSFGAAAVLGTNDNFATQFEANGATAMTILPNGNVGIGTTNPAYRLEVNGANVRIENATAVLDMKDSDSPGPTYDTYFQFRKSNDGSTGYLGYNNSSTFRINTNQSTSSIALAPNNITSIFASGSTNFVGIGTSSPNEQLTVEGPMSLRAQAAPSQTANYGKVYVDSGDANKLKYMNPAGAITDLTAGASSFANGGNSFGAAATLGTNDNFALNIEANNTTAMTVLPSGNVGIGTTSPIGALQISNADLGDQLVVTGTSSANAPQLRLQSTAAGGGSWYMGATDTGNTIGGGYFILNNVNDTSSSKLVVSSVGNVGIGTTNPSALLNIHKAGGGGSIIRLEGEGQTEVRFYRSSNDGQGGNFEAYKSRGTLATPTVVTNGDNAGSLKFKAYDGNSFEELASIVGEVDGTPGDGDMPGVIKFFTTPDGAMTSTEKMRISAGGNVGIGTVSPNQLLTVEGPMSLRAQAAPTLTANYGKVYVDSGDSNKLKYMNPAGAITDLTAGGSGFANGGNSFGAAATLGTNDNYDLSFETNGASRLTIKNNGDFQFGGNIGLHSAKYKFDFNPWSPTSGTSVNTATYSFINGASAGSADFIASNSQIISNRSAAQTGKVIAVQGLAEHNGAGAGANLSNLKSGEFYTQVGAETATNVYGIEAQTTATGSGSITNNYGVNIKSAVDSSTGSIANNYGLYIENQSVGTTSNYAIYSAGGTNYFAGNVGIGTTSPNSNLDVSSAAGGAMTLSRDDTTVLTGNYIGSMLFKGNDSQLTTQNLFASIAVTASQDVTTDAAAANMFFNVGGTTAGSAPLTRMAIDSLGNVAIGTATGTPYVGGARSLRVLSTNNQATELNLDSTGNAAGANPYVNFAMDGTRVGYILAQKSAMSAIDASLNFATHNGTTLAERMRITQAGQVGIGTTTPNQLLTVEGPMSLRAQAAPSLTANYGKIYVDSGDSNKLKYMNPAGSITDLTAVGSASLSSVTAATATNTIANANFAQAWNWDTLTTQTAMSLGTNSATSGTLLNLTNSFNSATSTGNVLKLAATGASNAAVPLMLTNAGTGNTLRVNDDGTDTDTSPFVIDADGNVGIGTTSPVNKFNVTDGNGYVRTGTIGLGGLRVKMDRTDASTALVVRNGADTELFKVLTDGLVGVGTTTPNQLLTVEGPMSLRAQAAPSLTANYGKIYVDSGDSNKLKYMNPAGTVTDLTAGAGTAFVNGGNSFAGAATIGTNDNNALNLEANGSTAMTINPDGTVGVGNSGANVRMAVTGGLRIDNADQSNGHTWEYGLSFGGGSGEGITSKRSAGGNAYGLDLFTASTARISITQAGNVGIGTSAPSYLLDVNGTAEANTVLVGDGAVATPAIAFSSATSTGIMKSGVGFGFVTTGTLRYIMDDNNIRSSNGNGFLLSNGASPSTATSPIYTRGGDTNTGLFFPNPDELAVTTGGTERLRFDSTGRVAIGTTTPNQLLTVEGPMSLRAQAAPTLTANYGKIYVDSGDSNKLKYMNPAGTITDLTAAGGTGGWTDSGATISTTTASDSVGIGVSPSYKLDVSGDVNSTTVYRLGGVTGIKFMTGPYGGAQANLFVGTASDMGSLNTTAADRNVAVGTNAGAAIVNSSENTYIGFAAGQSSNANQNTFIGNHAAYANTTGGGNVAIGAQTLTGLTTGTSNVVVGGFANGRNVSGHRNIVMGVLAAGGNSGASGEMNDNVVIGHAAGYVMEGGTPGNGSNGNILIGHQAGNTITTGDRNVLLGFDIDTPSATTSNFMSLGNIIFATGVDGTGTTVSSGNVGIGTTSPQAALDVVGTGTSRSAMIVPRDTTANRPTTPVEGMIRYNTTTKATEVYQGTTPGWGGIPSLIGKVDLTGQTAAIAKTNIFTPTVDGMYQICFYTAITTPGTSGNVNGLIEYQHESGTTNKQTQITSLGVTLIDGASSNCTATFLKSGTALGYLTNLTGTAGALQYTLHIRVHRMD